ncbi:MAG TPA: tol-pal system-associated acyl-CoA thioesterase [Casimicrobiaceae bacterium]|jgi:tol-pal system-associated acyl-CoA thioesterase|nr:tol-pal system-associated acyl-CoA thioesterase [Casimicrobiaceae bacterium]
MRKPFRWPVRVYYEDTDADGIVYYANYLKFLERARTEWLAEAGFTHAALAREHRLAFVVHRLEIEYRAPARLYDALEVTAALVQRGRGRLVMAQDVLRDGAMLASAQVTLACLDTATWRPKRIPAAIAAKMESPS